jgi:hypothetical protein
MLITQYNPLYKSMLCPVLLQLKPRRVYRTHAHRQLTQAELLAEAAKTEIENIKSLQVLQLIEEESKKKAQVKKGKYVGPMVRLRSHAVEGQEQVRSVSLLMRE